MQEELSFEIVGYEDNEPVIEVSGQKHRFKISEVYFNLNRIEKTKTELEAKKKICEALQQNIINNFNPSNEEKNITVGDLGVRIFIPQADEFVQKLRIACHIYEAQQNIIDQINKTLISIAKATKADADLVELAKKSLPELKELCQEKNQKQKKK